MTMDTKTLSSVTMLLAVLTAPVSQAAPDGRQIASQGMGGAPCMSCHGLNGEGNAAAGFPRLAGMNADYLAAQLQAFKQGTRQNPVMAPQVVNLDSAAMRAVAGFYAQLPPPASQAPAPDAGLADHGRRLAEQGRWADQVPACVQCHGPGGRGIAPHFPTLAGQHAAYISSQITAWKNGQRHNDPNGLMSAVAERLTDTDIQAVSAWFASQPAQ